jgi:hypothetical protein
MDGLQDALEEAQYMYALKAVDGIPFAHYRMWIKKNLEGISRRWKDSTEMHSPWETSAGNA